MEKQDYTATIVVNATPEKAFDGINQVISWWTENIEGRSEKLNDVFIVHFGETFVTMKIIESVCGKKVVWNVKDCYLHWLADKKEWKNTQVLFEIFAGENSTRIEFTHLGLVPGTECYEGCVKGWDQYIKDSLAKFINEGRGMPQKKQQIIAGNVG